MGLSPAFPGLFFAFAAMALLIFVSVSPPVWEKVNFLDATIGGQETIYGVFAQCTIGQACDNGKASIGYSLAVPGADDTVNNVPGVLRNLSYGLILHPIGAALGFIAVVFGIIGIAAASRFATIMMSMAAALGALVTLVVFVFDMVIFNILRNRIRDAGGDAMLGNANWLTVGAVVAFFLSMCTSFCGACGRFASGRAAGEKY